MSYELFIDGLRLVDAILASVVFCLLMNRGRLFWDQYDTPQKWMYSSFTLYTLATAYTSFELYAQDVSTGYRSYIILCANLFALYALWRWRHAIIIGTLDDKHPSTRR